MAEFNQSTFTVDRDATARAYAAAERGYVDSCDCAPCRNFRLARDRVFPADFLKLLDALGIDPHKDGDVYHQGQAAPGRHSYGGWFHFVGTLEPGGASVRADLGGDFFAYMCAATAPRLSTLEGLDVVQLEFEAGAVPWVLDEPEP